MTRFCAGGARALQCVDAGVRSAAGCEDSGDGVNCCAYANGYCECDGEYCFERDSSIEGLVFDLYYSFTSTGAFVGAGSLTILLGTRLNPRELAKSF
jgi:hypothetical protein